MSGRRLAASLALASVGLALLGAGAVAPASGWTAGAPWGALACGAVALVLLGTSGEGNP